MRSAAVLTVPRGMTERRHAELRAALDDYLVNARGRPLILEEGMSLSWVDTLTGRRLPSTFAEYRAGLYGAPSRDWLPALNGGLLAAALALAVLVASVVLR